MKIGIAIKKQFPEAQTITINMRHNKAVTNYVTAIEDAHRKAAKSKLHFGIKS
jgi:hypothetical protein